MDISMWFQMHFDSYYNTHFHIPTGNFTGVILVSSYTTKCRAFLISLIILHSGLQIRKFTGDKRPLLSWATLAPVIFIPHLDISCWGKFITSITHTYIGRCPIRCQARKIHKNDPGDDTHLASTASYLRVTLRVIVRMIETAEMLATTRFSIYNCCCGMNRNRDVHMEVLESPNEWPTMEQLMRIHNECVHMLYSSPRICKSCVISYLCRR